MSGVSVVKVPAFLENDQLPPGYYDTPNPYINPPIATYNIRAMVNYALAQEKKVTDLTREEANLFLLNN